MDRRTFLTAACATAVAPAWAAVGSPRYLAAAKRPDGSFALHGLGEEGRSVFEIALPDRGHAAAARPSAAEAVAFARRPGTFAIVLDCAEGREIARLKAPKDRHFYGHGIFSPDGATLYTTENAYQIGEGRIGVWNAAEGYQRVGEFGSGGIGPHDLKLMPGDAGFVAANGGIRTHPDYGREKLNLPDMRPNLSYLSPDGELIDRVEPPETLRKASTRHLAVRGDGLVAAAMQWEGPKRQVVPLLALHRRGEELQLLSGPSQNVLKGYAGSVAFSGDDAQVAITAPRGGLVQVFDSVTSEYAASHYAVDVCGLSAGSKGFVATTGEGYVLALDHGSEPLSYAEGAWDNHLIRL